MKEFISIEDSQSFEERISKLVKDAVSAALREVLPDEVKNTVLTRTDILKKYRISETTLWKRQKDGTLPYHKIGRRVFFYQAEVEEALNRKYGE